MNLSSLKNKISKLSKSPGVYIFYGKNRKTLYVGKATNLKSRVGSYFSLLSSPSSALRAPSPGGRSGYGRPIDFAIDQIVDIKTLETDSVLEALILESHLIKKLQPKYNAIGKDDKSFAYFMITKEEFPRVLILRKTDLFPHPALRATLSQRERGIKIAKKFGPYTSKKQMEIALKIMRRIFPFHSMNAKTEKGCLDYQISRCPGPYAGAISKANYLKNICGIRMILEGKKKSLVIKLEKEMKIYAKNNEFEKAAEARNKVFALKHIRDVALISEDSRNVERGSWNGNKNDARYALRDMRIEAYDISNISGQHATGSMVVFGNNEPDKSQYRKFKIKTVVGMDDVGMMKEILTRRFKNNWPKPDLILLDGGVGHLNMAIELLKDLELNINIAAVAKGPSRKKLEVRSWKLENNKAIKNLLDNNNLLKHIMDEAHRFAIGYHRRLRKKSMLF